MTDDIKERLIEAYMKERPALLRSLTARFRDANTAEDLVQEVYLKIKKTHFTQPIKNEGAFLYRIASNIALDHRRKAKSDASRDGNWQKTTTHTEGGIPVHDAPKADSIVDAKQKLTRLHKLINELPPQARAAFIANKIQGKTQAEVATTLNISKSAVEKLIARAVKYLAEHIEADR